MVAVPFLENLRSNTTEGYPSRHLHSNNLNGKRDMLAQHLDEINTNEARWAKLNFWPLFDDYANRSGERTK